jgi:hypothetical protein
MNGRVAHTPRLSKQEPTKFTRDFAGAPLVLIPQLRDERSLPQARVGTPSSDSCGNP